MRIHRNVFWVVSVALCLFIDVGCGSRNPRTTLLLPFSVTNEVVGGEIRQILQVTNGMSLYFTRSDLVVWFCEGSAISIEFDPGTLKPLNVLLKTPASGDQPAASILDNNADGVPEFRQITGESSKQILYRGEWYQADRKGETALITVDGEKVIVKYDGRRWVQVHDSLER